MQRAGGISRRTVLVALGACVLCFYLGRLTGSHPGPPPHPRPNDDSDAPMDRFTNSKESLWHKVKELEGELKALKGKGKDGKITTCHHSSIVKDNERAARRGWRPDGFMVECKPETLGTGRGEWKLCTKKFGDETVIISAGVGRGSNGVLDLSFERDIVDAYQATVYIFDPTPAAQQLTKRLISSAEGTFKEIVNMKKFVYHPIGLWHEDGAYRFKKDGSMTDSEGTNTTLLPVARLNTFFCMFMPHWVDVLKIEIPGTPQELLDEIERTEDLPIDQILVHFPKHVTDAEAKHQDKLVRNLRRRGYYPYFQQLTFKMDEKVTFVKGDYLTQEIIDSIEYDFSQNWG